MMKFVLFMMTLVLVGACKPRPSELSLATKIDAPLTENLSSKSNSELFLVEPILPEEVVDGTTLQVQTISLKQVEIQNQTALQIIVQADAAADYFEYGVCLQPHDDPTQIASDATQDPCPDTFTDGQGIIIGTQKLVVDIPSGKYSVFVRGCAELHHTVNEADTCSTDWASADITYEEAKQNEITKSNLLLRNTLEQDLFSTCSASYIFATEYTPDSMSDPNFAQLVENFLNQGVAGCVQIAETGLLVNIEDTLHGTSSNTTSDTAVDSSTTSDTTLVSSEFSTLPINPLTPFGVFAVAGGDNILQVVADYKTNAVNLVDQDSQQGFGLVRSRIARRAATRAGLPPPAPKKINMRPGMTDEEIREANPGLTKKQLAAARGETIPETPAARAKRMRNLEKRLEAISPKRKAKFLAQAEVVNTKRVKLANSYTDPKIRASIITGTGEGLNEQDLKKLQAINTRDRLRDFHGTKGFLQPTTAVKTKQNIGSFTDPKTQKTQILLDSMLNEAVPNPVRRDALRKARVERLAAQKVAAANLEIQQQAKRAAAAQQKADKAARAAANRAAEAEAQSHNDPHIEEEQAGTDPEKATESEHRWVPWAIGIGVGVLVLGGGLGGGLGSKLTDSVDTQLLQSMLQVYGTMYNLGGSIAVLDQELGINQYLLGQ